MPRTAVPTPLAAVVGLVPAVLSGVCSLPSRALRLPALALTTTFTLVGAVRQEYDDLAARGEQLYAKLRGQHLGAALDALEDRAEDLIDQTPFAKAYATVEDVTENVTDFVTEVTEQVRDRVTGDQPESNRQADDRTSSEVGAARSGMAGSEDGLEDGLVDGSEVVAELPEDEQPKGTPTPKAPQNKGSQNKAKRSSGQVETAASPEVVELVQEIVAELAAGAVIPQPMSDKESSSVLAHGDLPLPGYDHLTLGSLRGRLRALDVVQLVQLRDYEKAHANRLPVVTMLDNRIAKLGIPGATPVALSGDSGSNGSAHAT